MSGRRDDFSSSFFCLMAQYRGRTVIPVEDICRDFFSHLTPAKFIRNVNEGKIPLPVIRIDKSAKSARGVHLASLAAYLDECRDEAEQEARQVFRGRLSA